MKSKEPFLFSFFILGLVSIIAQVLCLRELMVTFYGNELFLGLALGFWLFWTAVGSFIGKKFISRKAFLANLVVLAFLLPGSLILIRLLKTFFPLGAMIDLSKAIGLTSISLAPLGFSLGFFFTTAFVEAPAEPKSAEVRFSGQRRTKSKALAPIASQAYLIETLGFAMGGLLLNFYLLPHPPLLINLLFSLLIMSLAVLYPQKKIILLPLFLLLIFALAQVRLLESETLNWQFPGLVEERSSIYGRIAVTQSKGQYNFFESGALLGVNQKTEDVEYLIHPILLQHPQPERILMIGGGLDGGLAEILKHQPGRVSYVELDPVLVKTVKKYLAPELAQALEDKRIETILEDPRKFLKETQEKYDVAIINLPPPSTALINRLYTQEAMGEIRQTLKPNGILAINLNLPTDYLSEEATNLSRCFYQTIKQEFSQIMVLPEYTLLFLASNQEVLTNDAEILSQKLITRQIKTDFISPSYLTNRLHNDRIAKFTQELEKESKINYDFHPIAYFYQTAFWQGYFSRQLAAFFTQLPQITLPIGSLLLAGILFVLLRRPSTLPSFILAFTGATIMIWEVSLIFAFQVKLGYIYQQISLLLATLLVGMALGNYLASRYLNFKKHLKIIFLLIILFSLTMPIILEKANQEAVFLALSLIAGILTGTLWPLTTQGFLKKRKQIGTFYAVDLIGSFLGAVLVSLFLIPIFGLKIISFLPAFLFLPPLFLLKSNIK